MTPLQALGWQPPHRTGRSPLVERRRGASRGRLLCVLILGISLSACSSEVPSSHRPSQPTARSETAPPERDSSSTAVTNAYRAAWSAFEHAAADANPDDPELAATMVDPQLQGVKANLLADRQQGIVGRGTFTLHPKVTSRSGTSATVVDCAYSTAILVYAKTGKQVPPITQPENDGVTSTLVLASGMWKVYKQTVTDGKCAPAS